MAQTDDLACRLLRLEQQLLAYERLHAGEMAELWKILDQCKRAVAHDSADPQPADPGEPNGLDSTPRSPHGPPAKD